MRELLRTHPSERVTIVLLTGIGDVVHGLPIACDLKRDDPHRRIRWIAEPAPAEVLRHHPDVDEVVVFRRADGIDGLADLQRALRGPGDDITLNMQRYFKSLVPTLLSGARVRVGLPPSKTRDLVRFFNTHHLPEQPWRHMQDILLDYRGVLGLPEGAPVRWRITFSEEERAEQQAFFREMEGGAKPPTGDARSGGARDSGGADAPVAGVVAATANPAKDWPAAWYPELVPGLARMGYRVVLIGGTSAAERSVVQRIQAESDAPAVDATADSVRRMMWLVDGVDLLVSPDTGPLHIAHALGVPVVGLYGHTNPWRVGPWRRFRDLLVDRYTDPDDEPDPSAYEPKTRRMVSITADDVLARVLVARERYGAGQRKTLEGRGAGGAGVRPEAADARGADSPATRTPEGAPARPDDEREGGLPPEDPTPVERPTRVWGSGLGTGHPTDEERRP